MSKELLLTKEEVKRCGIGMGHECCAYLLCGPKGFECGRVLDDIKAHLDKRVKDDNIVARRQPLEAYPNCQLKEEIDVNVNVS